jgi:dynein heavy chain
MCGGFLSGRALNTRAELRVSRCRYVVQMPFDMAATFAESSTTTPVFFVLFPGVDPTVWVEDLGKQRGLTLENGRFINISMGQGQEKPAEVAIEKFAREGGWVMLQNTHLMQSWLTRLERQLEVVQETAHKDFRCFISAEPPPLPYVWRPRARALHLWKAACVCVCVCACVCAVAPVRRYLKNAPESLMQSCIKVANEAPADLKSNLSRAWSEFTETWIEGSTKPAPFKACLFTLCFYHAIVQGRRRFGQQGWSKRYSFNSGDLRVCANVLMDYVNNNAHVPWEDLRCVGCCRCAAAVLLDVA